MNKLDKILLVLKFKQSQLQEMRNDKDSWIRGYVEGRTIAFEVAIDIIKIFNQNRLSKKQANLGTRFSKDSKKKSDVLK